MFFDWGEEVGCGRAECAPGCECDRFLEFWNLVFMEFELHADGSLTPLPKQNIDTGLGLERAARILQQVDSVFDTDGYQEIMGWIAGQSGVAYGESERATKAHRILADHGRGMTFLAADGVTPSNEGRGYVMRRVIRRAVLQAGRIGLEPPFLAGLAGVVVEQMGEAYPELRGRARRDRAGAGGGGAALRRDARARADAVRGGGRRRRDLRRRGLPAARHLRLPARADRRAGPRARAAGGRGPLPRPDGGAAPALAQGRERGRGARLAATCAASSSATRRPTC